MYKYLCTGTRLAIAECKWGDEYIYDPLKKIQ